MSKEIEKMTAIYEKHKNTMYAVALKILKNPQDAEDAVHNTIPPIMRNLDAIKDVDSKDCIYYVTMAVKHTDKIFYFGIFGRLFGIENRIRWYCKFPDEFIEDIKTGFLSLVLNPI